MDLMPKLKILTQSAKYDVSCSSSGSSRKNKQGGTGDGHLSGICHSWSEDGRCISLLKILMSNDCIYNCSYCVNRSSADVDRVSLTPEELCSLTMNFCKRNYIEGLFLSSAVYKNPNYTMELMLSCIKQLRLHHNFNGYIHLKAIPGADLSLIHEAGMYADRMSVNIELPTSTSLKLLAPQKAKDAILRPMKYIGTSITETREERRFNADRRFLPAGHTTQLIVGASPESDLTILRLSEGLYKSFNLKRVYYSAYVPVSGSPNLPAISSPPLLREHRLYQADWLLRFYGFNAGEILDESHQNLDVELDPKSYWALNNIGLFPVDVNTADYSRLLRIPGIGVRSARKILYARRWSALSYYDLKKLGVILKRARHFITCSGKYYGEYLDNRYIRNFLLPDSIKNEDIKPDGLEQLSLFSLINDRQSAITGEL